MAAMVKHLASLAGDRLILSFAPSHARAAGAQAHRRILSQGLQGALRHPTHSPAAGTAYTCSSVASHDALVCCSTLGLLVRVTPLKG